MQLCYIRRLSYYTRYTMYLRVNTLLKYVEKPLTRRTTNFHACFDFISRHDDKFICTYLPIQQQSEHRSSRWRRGNGRETFVKLLHLINVSFIGHVALNGKNITACDIYKCTISSSKKENNVELSANRVFQMESLAVVNVATANFFQTFDW